MGLLKGPLDWARAYLQALRQLNRDVRLFMVSVVVSGASYMGLYFLLINLYLLRLGYDLKFIGLFVSIGAFSFAFFSLPAGAVGRRWGSRKPMICGLAVLSLGLAMLGLTALVPVPWRAPWLIFFCALRECGNAFYIVNSNPYLMQVTSPVERDYAFSVRAMLTPLAGFLGALAGGWLPAASALLLGRAGDDPLNFMLPLLLAAGLLVPGLVALVRTREPEMPGPTEVSRPRGDRPMEPFVTIAAISLLFIVAASAGQSFYHVYLDTVLKASTQLIGGIASCGQLLSAAAMLASPALMRRWGHGRMFVLMALGMGLIIVPMALVGHWLVVGLSVMGLVALMSFASTALTVFHQELVPTVWRSAMSGACLMAMGLGWGLVASGGGYFIATWGWSSFFLCGAGATWMGAAIFWLRFVRGRPGPVAA
ncbi:MAG: MFS transporter [Candidatus Latescibacteria bacterium]|nr:MFS transporter [Candidatus Latescibacterota bacterium]